MDLLFRLVQLAIGLASLVSLYSRVFFKDRHVACGMAYLDGKYGPYPEHKSIVKAKHQLALLGWGMAAFLNLWGALG